MSSERKTKSTTFQYLKECYEGVSDFKSTRSLNGMLITRDTFYFGLVFFQKQ